ncbi:biotin--[acetyl-CoA-carboxylase] ligase [Agrobacterium vitis]|uniref:biotin--[biotin carboxyl-carrier protein] ligase n=1 Tax=Agrobacterium vitis TaxID=373 RepID=A0AAE2UW44_AGRVI|nr:biotin--[acetyl-CoA-carboxylase] ligase [Agrobacterium vitis]MBF2716450.1 biotin--[acetyl-CoA-carboxylase] ligase [Agrobacterium vitis]MUZ63388.1 biotin--[acetyl-CoA-carboxylase] ligase [Agrobacterium vitis]
MSDYSTHRRKALDAFRHIALDEVDSTNQQCLIRARDGDPGDLWITANRQTGGRGRRGRPWASEPGNLYSSLLLIDPAPLADLASLPLAVAVAVHDAIGVVLPSGAPPLEIKWPNDVLIGRAKTSGILLEAERTPDGRNALVIGIGINLVFKPTETPYPTASLAEHGAAVTPDELFTHLFAAMADALALWDRGRGVKAVMQRWRQVACGIGEKITVNLPDRSISGVFSGIDDKGILLLDRGSLGITPVAAGDVFFEPNGPRKE